MCQDARTEDVGFFDPTNPLHQEFQEIHRSDGHVPGTDLTTNTVNLDHDCFYTSHGNGD